MKKAAAPRDKYFLRSLHQEIDLYDRKLADLQKFGDLRLGSRPHRKRRANCSPKERRSRRPRANSPLPALNSTRATFRGRSATHADAAQEHFERAS